MKNFFQFLESFSQQNLLQAAWENNQNIPILADVLKEDDNILGYLIQQEIYKKYYKAKPDREVEKEAWEYIQNILKENNLTQIQENILKKTIDKQTNQLYKIDVNKKIINHIEVKYMQEFVEDHYYEITDLKTRRVISRTTPINLNELFIYAENMQPIEMPYEIQQYIIYSMAYNITNYQVKIEEKYQVGYYIFFFSTSEGWKLLKYTNYQPAIYNYTRRMTRILNYPAFLVIRVDEKKQTISKLFYRNENQNVISLKPSIENWNQIMQDMQIQNNNFIVNNPKELLDKI